LAAALAMLVSIAVMIHSFRKSVQQWLDHTLLADFYLAPAVNEIAGPQAFLPDSLISTIQTNESVKLLTKFREIPIVYNNLPASLVILDGPARGKLVLLDKEPPPASDRLKQENAALISESFAQRFQVHKGQKISLPLPNGQQLFEIAGVFRDYTRDSGTIMISLDNYVRNGGNSQAHSLAIYLKQGTNFAQFHAFLNRLAESSLPISIYSNLQLKQRVGEIFDSTFAVTEVLRLVAIVVAISGVLFSFGILIRERSWEIALLRAIGASRSQITLLVLAESAALGLAASFFGIIGGASLALVLTYVINKAFFGWTINLLYPLPFLSTIPLWVTSLALLAALFPAWKAAKIQPAEALRLE
ncbi:MAG: ABC transporter permease, partial [Chthoniobacterales bacterium]|nr:ABC transporter permease [Chthoniobacterales bacterium]